MSDFAARLRLVPDPHDPSWRLLDPGETGRFIDLFGPIRIRTEGPSTARCRFHPAERHRNANDGVHGGYAMAIVDQVLFVVPHALGRLPLLSGVTIDTATQFLAPLSLDQPLDAVVEILRETGRMMFMRGLIEQGGTPAVAFSGTIRKTA